MRAQPRPCDNAPQCDKEPQCGQRRDMSQSRMPRQHQRHVLLFALYSAALLGCSDEDDHEHDHEDHGVATEAQCPSSDPPTYETFGRTFMSSYCVRCHSSELTGDARQGAPVDHDFDTLEGVLPLARVIDQYAGAGPAGENEAMPPDGAQPTAAERMALAEWLACEVPDDVDAGEHHHHE